MSSSAPRPSKKARVGADEATPLDKLVELRKKLKFEMNHLEQTCFEEAMRLMAPLVPPLSEENKRMINVFLQLGRGDNGYIQDVDDWGDYTGDPVAMNLPRSHHLFVVKLYDNQPRELLDILAQCFPFKVQFESFHTDSSTTGTFDDVLFFCPDPLVLLDQSGEWDEDQATDFMEDATEAFGGDSLTGRELNVVGNGDHTFDVIVDYHHPRAKEILERFNEQYGKQYNKEQVEQEKWRYKFKGL